MDSLTFSFSFFFFSFRLLFFFPLFIIYFADCNSRVSSAINFIFEMPQNVYASAYVLSKNKQIGWKKRLLANKKRNEKKIDESAANVFCPVIFTTDDDRKNERGCGVAQIRIKRQNRRPHGRLYVGLYCTRRYLYNSVGQGLYFLFSRRHDLSTIHACKSFAISIFTRISRIFAVVRL